MSRNSETKRTPSLAQHFDAPDDYIGHFGWLCGYSADALFLDDATERFTRLTRPQRAHQGRAALAVFLDPGNPPVSWLEAPAMAHLPIKDIAQKPFHLLHAKVALLGYRHQNDPNQWQLRLLVSTGNWTRQTLEESLDLAWRIDLTSKSLSHIDANIKQDCADIKAAWDLLDWIQERFDTRLLNDPNHDHPNETIMALQQVSRWIDMCSKMAQGKPRFFDNRSKSLLSQLPEKIKDNSIVRRNYLAMGSGFYEKPDDPQKAPKVPKAIIKTLNDNHLLTPEPEIDIFVNPMACQAIATTQGALQRKGVTIRPTAIPAFVFGEDSRRTLHAKFIFSTNSREDSNACSSSWVYLGSGNLTQQGFTNKMSASAGNLEAGVVFAPKSLCWQKNKATPAKLVVTNLLPIQRDEKIGESTPLSAGSDMEQRDTIYLAPPIAWLKWHEANGICELRSDEPSISDVQVLNPAGNACIKTGTGFLWSDAYPRQVSIIWQADGKQHEGRIPVIDQYGRIAATELSSIDIEECWWQLSDFPMPPDEDDGDDKDSEDVVIVGNDRNQKGSAPIDSYPIRQMMELIESIATKQTDIDEVDWVLWCNRLEQSLGQACNSDPVKYFRDELKLNPLSPLHHQEFRPKFAETSDSGPGKLYDDTLARIEERWMVNELSPIGGTR